MAPASAEATEPGGAAAREARIAAKTDALCLAHMLAWSRGGFMVLPMAVVTAYLAYADGAGLWAIAWLVAWVARQAWVHRLSRRLERDAPAVPGQALASMTKAFAVAGVHAALPLAFFFLRSNDVVLLFVSCLMLFQGGAVVQGVSGVLAAWLAYSAPSVCVMLVGWLWHGGSMGFVLAYMMGTAFPFAIISIRTQRREFVELVRLLEDNEALTASLKAERDRAEAASESKTRFFAAASHDLRQPLHALSINATTLDLVARRSGDRLLKDVSQGIGSALRQSRGLLDGLLDISRLDAQAIALNPAPQDVVALLEAVRDEFAALAAQRGLSLDVQAPPLWVMTDADQLLRILGNLVDNAVKFTTNGGVVLRAERSARGRVTVSVSDTGPGIPEADRGRVFEEFYQVGNPSRDRTLGLGLGLAIVKRTAQLLEAPLRLVCEPGRGARFELSLRESAPDVVTPATAQDGGAGKTHSVLVVDDEPDGLRSVCTYLQELGWRAQGVTCGADAERALDEGFRPDVMVVDYRLRGETGRDVIARLHARYPALPAVVVTGDTGVAQLRVLSDLAATVLHKPLDGAHLAKALSEAIEAREVVPQLPPRRGDCNG